MNPKAPIKPCLGKGLSVRDHIALELLKIGISKRVIPNFQGAEDTYSKFVSRWAYEFADDFIAESNKK